jgi:hypothetical protein
MLNKELLNIGYLLFSFNLISPFDGLVNDSFGLMKHFNSKL